MFKECFWPGKLVGLFAIPFFLLFSPDVAHAQGAEKGKADLTTYQFDKEESARLSGTWEFYWNKLLTPADFNTPQKAEWIKVPGSWHWQKDYPVCGVATYRIHLQLPKIQSGLVLYFPIINASAKVWINDTLVEETGTVSSDEKQYRAQLANTIVPLPENVSEMDVIVQVANFSYFGGGIASVPQVDRASAVFSKINRSNGIENFFAGSLIALFIYQIILYFLFHKGKPYLWLALICLGVALRAMIVHNGSFLLPNLFPSVSWEFWKKIEFGSVYGIVALFPLYVYDLFPEPAPKKPIYFFVSIASLLCIGVILLPQYYYGQALDVCHVGLLLGFIYAVYSISKAWRAGNKDARIILFGVLASFPFILAEILKNSLFIPFNFQFMHMVELGVLVFLLFQVYLLANHYAQSFKKLETINIDLERIVEERTSQLKTANTVKDRLLSVMSHDIKSPLNSLRGILNIFNKGTITKDDLKHYTQHIENDLGKTTMLVENILHWTNNQLKGIQVHKEEFVLNKLIEENIQLLHTIATNKKISIRHDLNGQLIINSDRNILNLVVRNLVSNAIKFSHEGGTIDIHVNLTNQLLKIEVKDQGVGMGESTLQKLFVKDTNVTTAGTNNEKGTGLGLALCNDYLVKAGGQLLIESKKGEGSSFSILIDVES
ncbi:MAG TPA: 7TM diverse intracellular signaling domain-containing protein [Cyclobacteriaceae bacterium]